MEVNQDKKNPKETSKERALQRRSLNNNVSSKNAHQVVPAQRGHVSQALQSSVIQNNSANKSENVIESLEKHRNTKSNKKSESGKKPIEKNVDSIQSTKKSLTKGQKMIQQVKTVQQGENWINIIQNSHQIITIEGDENQNTLENKDSKMRTRNHSKKKVQTENEVSHEKVKQNLKSKSKNKSVAKSAAKSKKNKSINKKTTQQSTLKRNKMRDKSLTNQENPTSHEEVKSCRKSNPKSKQKNQ